MGKVLADGGLLEVQELAESQSRMRRPQSSKFQRRTLIGLLLFVDVLMFGLGIYAARFGSHEIFDLPSGRFFGSSFAAVYLALAAYLAIYWAYGLYNAGQLSSGGSDSRSVGNANAVGLVAAILIAGFATNWELDARTIVPFWFCTTTTALIGRFAMRRFIFLERRRGRPVERTLILGANSE